MSLYGRLNLATSRSVVIDARVVLSRAGKNRRYQFDGVQQKLRQLRCCSPLRQRTAHRIGRRGCGRERLTGMLRRRPGLNKSNKAEWSSYSALLYLIDILLEPARQSLRTSNDS